LALKAEDGAGRAAQVAVLALLRALGALDDAARAALVDLAEPILHNHAGRRVGRIGPAPGWPDLATA
jgi:L-asparaginase II